jgi:hypothetical protein
MRALREHLEIGAAMFSPTRSILVSAFVVVAFSAAGCDAILGHALNPKFCEAHPDDPDCMKAFPDAAPDGPKTCTSDQQCGGAAPVCDLEAGGSKTCVECTVAEHTLCTGATPACIDDKCAKCTAHAQCDASNVCLPDGTCADAGQVAYVQAGGTGAAPCAKDAPCGTLDDGVKAAKPTIKISGTVADSKTTIIDGQAVTIVSDPGAKLSRSNAGVVLQVQNDGADVAIYDLEITLGTGLANPAVSIPAGGTPKLSLSRVLIDSNQGVGVSTSGGVLTIARSLISGNSGGGLSLAATQYAISNSFIVSNGGPNSAIGGVNIATITDPGTYNFEFNTLAGNQAKGSLTAGLVCSSIGIPLTFADSIVYSNGLAMQVEGSNCTWNYSDVGQALTAGTGDLNQDPKFVDVNNGNYHLQAGSPAENAADPAANVSIDFDGDPRPQGGRSDMGADEVNQ